MDIVFMGTPEFAVPCLKAIWDAGHRVVGVFTQPDKPAGRGYRLTPPPVKVLAAEKGIPVYQPPKLRDGEVLSILRTLSPALIVVVAYGKILPPDILALPPKGCINVHASLLPKYRGAAPIQWSVVNGEKETGVTTMYMAEGMDTGDIIEMAATPIGPEETAGALHDRLSLLGAQLLAHTLGLVEAGKAVRTPQDDAQATYASLIQKEMGELDFDKPAVALYDLIRGFSPWPGAYTFAGGKLLKVLRGAVAAETGQNAPPGTVSRDETGRLVVQCGRGLLALLEVRPEGGKAMTGAEYLRGHPLGVLGKEKNNG